MEDNNQNSNGTDFLSTIAFSLMKSKMLFIVGLPIVLMVLVFTVVLIVSGRTSGMEAIAGYGNKNCSGEGNGWASFITDEKEATTFYKKMNDLATEKNVDINLASAILTYGNPPDLSDRYACNSEEKDEEGNIIVEECENPAENSASAATKLYKESKKIINGIAGKNEEETRKWLKENFIEDRLKELDDDIPEDETVKSYYFDEEIQQIYELKEQYESLDCEEDIPSTGGFCSYEVDGKNVNNVYVKLMNCEDEGWGKPVVTNGNAEELVELEKYILGVTYAEHSSGSDEGVKAQAIAARSYAFGRAISMKNTVSGNDLVQEDGKWVLYMRNCTEDQVYCDPDRGCWAESPSAGSTVHSGAEPSASAAYKKGPVATDSKLREIVKSTKGQYAVDSSGKLFSTSYTNVDQIAWNEMGNQGLSVNQILTSHYPGLNTITSNCTAGTGATGDFLKWKQRDPAWNDFFIGSTRYTVGDFGCALTSVSILVMRSGLPLTIDQFNPGVASKSFGYTSLGEIEWDTARLVAPGFRYLTGADRLEGTRSREELASAFAEYMQKGHYIVVNVMNGGHYVALTGYENGNFIMSDPDGPDGVDLFSVWPAYTINGYRVYGVQ